MAKLYSKKTAYGLTPPFINIDAPTVIATYDPTLQDKYEVGQLWLNETLNTVWMLTSYALGVPVWTELDNGAGGGLVWTIEAGALIQLTNNHGYTLTNPGVVTMNLPIHSDIGSLIEIEGGALQWLIAQNAGQQIVIANRATTVGVGGYIASALARTNIVLRTVIADTTFHVFGSNGPLGTH